MRDCLRVLSRLFLACWLIASQVGIDVTSCAAQSPGESISSPSSLNPDTPDSSQVPVSNSRIVNGLGRVIDDHAICQTVIAAPVSRTVQNTTKSTCHCSPTRKLAGKCCCAGFSESFTAADSSPAPCGQLLNDTCGCTQELGGLLILKVPTTLCSLISPVGSHRLVTSLLLDNEQPCGLADEPAIKPPKRS